MSVCVIGSKGNMGRRYMAILRKLGVIHQGVDLWDQVPEHDHYIVATPTDTHTEVLMDLMQMKTYQKILVEKPVTKDPSQLRRLAHMAKMGGHKVYMVNQYAYRGHSRKKPGAKPATELTEYDYFNTGKDGLLWDCIQLIHMAEAEVRLSTVSPVRNCRINGRIYDSATTDHLYVSMIRDFIRARKWLWPIADTVKTHERIHDYAQSLDWSTGEIRFHTPQE